MPPGGHTAHIRSRPRQLVPAGWESWRRSRQAASRSHARFTRIAIFSGIQEQIWAIDAADRSPDGRWILFLRLDDSGGSPLGIPSEGGTPVNVLPGIQVLEHDERVAPGRL